MTKRKQDEGNAPHVNKHASALAKHSHEVRRERDPEGYVAEQRRASEASNLAQAHRTPAQKAETKARKQATWAKKREKTP